MEGLGGGLTKRATISIRWVLLSTEFSLSPFTLSLSVVYTSSILDFLVDAKHYYRIING
jgi:hypothetical protein